MKIFSASQRFRIMASFAMGLLSVILLIISLHLNFAVVAQAAF